MVMRSSIYFQGAADVAFGRRARARLDLGDAPQVAPLRDLDIDPDPVFTAFLPTTRGRARRPLRVLVPDLGRPG